MLVEFSVETICYNIKLRLELIVKIMMDCYNIKLLEASKDRDTREPGGRGLSKIPQKTPVSHPKLENLHPSSPRNQFSNFSKFVEKPWGGGALG